MRRLGGEPASHAIEQIARCTIPSTSPLCQLGIDTIDTDEYAAGQATDTMSALRIGVNALSHYCHFQPCSKKSFPSKNRGRSTLARKNSLSSSIIVRKTLHSTASNMSVHQFASFHTFPDVLPRQSGAMLRVLTQL